MYGTLPVEVLMGSRLSRATEKLQPLARTFAAGKELMFGDDVCFASSPSSPVLSGPRSYPPLSRPDVLCSEVSISSLMP